jgi:hypothetical protein
MVRVRHSLWGIEFMTILIHRLRGILIALSALALSATMVLGAQPTSTGLDNAATHAGKTVPVASGDVETAGDEDTSAEDSGDTTDENAAPQDSTNTSDNCATDPTALTPEELDAMRHGSIVCWAAQQTTWPDWFANHGAFVKCWAHQGKPDAIDCTQDPTTQNPTASGASTGHGNGKGKGHNK